VTDSDRPKRERRDVSIEPYSAPIARTGREMELPNMAPVRRAPGSHPVFGVQPAAELDEHVLANIRAVCQSDVSPSYAMIAARVGVSEGTLRRWLDEYPQLSLAIEGWRADGLAALRRRAYDLAMEGAPALVKLILESRDPDFRPDTRRDGFSSGNADDGSAPDATFL
jgi:hypothetical protein